MNIFALAVSLCLLITLPSQAVNQKDPNSYTPPLLTQEQEVRSTRNDNNHDTELNVLHEIDLNENKRVDSSILRCLYSFFSCFGAPDGGE